MLFAGGQIGKLRRAGFVSSWNQLTKAGRDALQSSDKGLGLEAAGSQPQTDSRVGHQELR